MIWSDLGFKRPHVAEDSLEGMSRRQRDPQGCPGPSSWRGRWGGEGESCASGSISTQATRRCPQPSSSSPRQNSSIPPPADFFFGPFSFDFLTRESLLLFEGQAEALTGSPARRPALPPAPWPWPWTSPGTGCQTLTFTDTAGCSVGHPGLLGQPFSLMNSSGGRLRGPQGPQQAHLPLLPGTPSLRIWARC